MPKFSHRIQLISGGLVLVALVIGLASIGYHYRDAVPPLEEMRQQVQIFLNTIPPLLYFAAFVILPTLGVPLTLFYLTAIPVMGTVHPAIGIAFAWVALALNMTLANLLGRGLLHPAIEWIIRHRHYTIPKIQPQSEWKVVVAMRLSPIPYVLQNYLLALGHSRWRYYLGASLLIQGTIGLAVMLVGESIITGGLGYVLLALFGLLVLHLIFDTIRKRLSTDRVTSN